ncbi:MAG: hypothetical protein MJE68_25640, partial [Proteobacteria bacterium]|nr:hypothetical protein [Pseudomonadota bacterium]
SFGYSHHLMPGFSKSNTCYREEISGKLSFITMKIRFWTWTTAVFNTTTQTVFQRRLRYTTFFSCSISTHTT